MRFYEHIIGSLRIDWINRIERSGWLRPRRLVVLDEAREGVFREYVKEFAVLLFPVPNLSTPFRSIE